MADACSQSLIASWKMSEYSIKDLERFSGIKAHTLRIWEQRYNLLSPLRTETNIRAYTNADLRHILNVSFLNGQGVKISHIAKLSHQEIHQKVLAMTEREIVLSVQINSFVAAMIAYDAQLFEKTFSLCCAKIGFNKTMVDIVYPFLQKVGVLWHTGNINPGQEHFIVNLIRQKLIVEADKEEMQPPSKTKIALLYLPENEYHDVALLYYNFLLKKLGHTTIYLGQSVPYYDLEKAYEQLKPDYLLAVITCPKEELNTQKYINKLSKDFKKATIFLSGYATSISGLKIPKNIVLFKNPEHITSRLTN